MKWFGFSGALVLVLVATLLTALYRSNQPADSPDNSRRPPYSMHAQQSEWIESCQYGKGTLQSPISLTTTRLGEQRESPLQIELLNSSAELLDVGHTFQIRYRPTSPGARARFEGNEYELRQFHFHKPSEHIIDGKQYEMEAHFVFFNKQNKIMPKALVIGVMILDGSHNKEIAKIWKYLPPYREGYGESKTEISDWKEAASTHELNVDTSSHHEKTLATRVDFNLSGILPEKMDFMIYDGSLTTPGCDEGITHAVSLTPVFIEHEQVEHFEGYYEGNNRDIQPIGEMKNRNFRRSSVVLGAGATVSSGE
jgi:carbonic anhydrase